MLTDVAEVHRQLRLQCLPPADHPEASWRTCRECGDKFWDWTRKWRHHCADCAAARARAQRADPVGWLESQGRRADAKRARPRTD